MFKKIFDKKHRSRTITYFIVIFAYIILELLLNTGGISSRFKSLLVPTTCYIVVAIALNMVVGISGELSLGHAGFMCVGAFTAVCVSGVISNAITSDILVLFISIIAGAIVAGIFGFLISVKPKYNITRNEITKYIEDHNVQTRLLFSGNLIKHPCFDQMRATGEGYRVVGDLTNTDRIMHDTFWIGVYPGMTDEMLDYMAKTIREALA